jgi:hypothetical protein
VTSLADVRRIAGSLPETEEVLTWGTDATFRVRGKIFAIGADDSHNLSVKATPATQAELIDLDPATFSVAALCRPVRVGTGLPRSDRAGGAATAPRRSLASDRAEAARRNARRAARRRQPGHHGQPHVTAVASSR